MKDFIFQKQWNWFVGGLALGIMFLIAVAFVKPIGVSTQFVILDSIIWDSVSDNIIVKNADSKSGYSSPNAYLNKSGGKYAKNAANPLNYSFVFVLAMVVGGFIASRLQSVKDKEGSSIAPPVWQGRFGDSPGKRFLGAFMGGILVLIGARLAGGCTSGHMMSGMMQTSISGYLFALGAFAIAVPVAVFMYKGGVK
jgi:hypothetical protein